MATLKGVFPDPKPIRKKNFIHENVRNLRKMEQFFHTNKEVEEFHKLQIQRQHKTLDKYQNVTSRINTCKHDETSDKTTSEPSNNKIENNKRPASKVSVPMLSNKVVAPVRKIHRPVANNSNVQRLKRGQKNPADTKSLQIRQKKAPSDPNLTLERSAIKEDITNSPVKYKNQGIQTLDAKHMSNLYSDGIIRYPTNRSPRKHTMMNKGESSQQTDETPRAEVNAPSDRGDISVSPTPREVCFNQSDLPLPKEEVDFVKLNKQRSSIASKMATLLNNGVPPPNYRKGVVPKYDVKNIFEIEKKLNNKKNKKLKQQHPILTARKVMSRFLTMNARKPYVC